MRLYDYDASANCFKVRLLLEFLGTDYERVPIDIFAGDTLTDAYGKLNPARETPVLELDDGRAITQSGAILTYLGHGTPWLPPGRFEQARIAEWLAFEQEHVMRGIGGPRFRLTTRRSAPESRMMAALLSTGRAALQRLDAVFGGQPFLLGDTPTIADVAVYGYGHLAAEVGIEGYAAVDAWCERIRSLPGYADDLAPYPPNSMAGASRSIYD